MKNQNAVAIVTKEELSLVDNILLNTNQLNLLTKKTPAKYLMTRPAKGGGNWNYVTGSYMKKVLNLMFGFNWNFEVQEYKYDLDIKQVFVLGKLTCTTGGQKIIKMQFGRSEIKFKTQWENGKKTTTKEPLDLGNDLKAATTDALKKCASEIGICSDIYGEAEFKELKVIDSIDSNGNDIDIYEIQKSKILKLMQQNIQLDQITHQNIIRILEDEDKSSYKSVLTLLNKLNS